MVSKDFSWERAYPYSREVYFKMDRYITCEYYLLILGRISRMTVEDMPLMDLNQLYSEHSSPERNFIQHTLDTASLSPNTGTTKSDNHEHYGLPSISRHKARTPRQNRHDPYKPVSTTNY